MWFDGAVSNLDGSSLAQRLNIKLYHVALLLGVGFLVLSDFRPLMDNVDLGWHVAQGRWMAEHGAIYRRDMMNYPNLDRPLVNEYPLFQIVLYGAWKCGWWGLFFVTMGVYGVLVITLLRAARSFLPAGSALFALTVCLMILYFQLAFPLRPHLVTYLCVAMLGVFLLRHRQAVSWTEFWPMALLQIAWTNCHSAFILGPAMVGLFGAEMIVRRSLQQRELDWPAVRIWAGAFFLILLACFVNPFGLARFYPPFYQGELESIRAYVGEMQPLTGLASSLLSGMTLLAAGLVVLAIIQARAVSYSFLLLGILFYAESLSVLKSWPVFGLFPPLLVLSSGAFGSARRGGQWIPWCRFGGNLLVAVAFSVGFFLRLDASSPISLPVVWREYDLGRREMPYAAVHWMKAHRIEGRLLHRCEDGGLLQESGYDHGETFSDTGFGKYDERLIHLVSMIGDRPALIPSYDAAYRPDYVVCNSLCYRWPFYLRQAGWRLVFYSPYGAVWTRPETRPDLPTVSGEEIEAAFAQDIALHGRPSDPLLYGRNLLALNSEGREDFAFSRLTSLPPELHRVSWYWEAARILCFETPRFSDEHRRQLVGEAERLHDNDLTAEFRAFAHAEDGDGEGARQILAALPESALAGHAADLLLKLELEQNRPEALALAERPIGFDLRDGRHWEYVAEAEDKAGQEEAAARAWKKAVFFYPDDAELMARARDFALKSHDETLAREVKTGAGLKSH